MAKIFDHDRYGFIVVGDTIVSMNPNQREMTTQEWARKVIGISEEDLPFCTRGYITRDRIQFFSDDYHTSPEVDAALVAKAVEHYCCIYNVRADEADTVPVFNGTFPGEEGDTWPPCLIWNSAMRWWQQV